MKDEFETISTKRLRELEGQINKELKDIIDKQLPMEEAFTRFSFLIDRTPDEEEKRFISFYISYKLNEQNNLN